MTTTRPMRAACVAGLVALAVGTPAPLAGCASTRIEMAERLGYAKREQLVDRVQEARDDQEEAKAQFASALDEFLSLPEVDAGALEAKYRELQRQLERSEGRASDVRDRIKAIERVASALFEEWERELEQYESAALRDASARQLGETRSQYDRLITKMRRAEASMDPVLAAFRDQVLFLKHNLNARAVASLSEGFGRLESDIEALIAEMEASIVEANAFIDQMSADAEAR